METPRDKEGVVISVHTDVESGQTLRQRNGLIGAFSKVGSYLFSSPSTAYPEEDEDDTLRKVIDGLIDAVNFTFTVDYMNGKFLDYVSSNLLLISPIRDWDPILLDDLILPSFDAGPDDEGDYCVHPLAPRLTVDAQFEVNDFCGSEQSVSLTCGISEGWIFGDTDVWIAEFKIVEFHCDVPDVSTEIRLVLRGRTDYLPCLFKGNEIVKRRNLLKPDKTKDFVLARNVMYGLYVSGKETEDLRKYSKDCGDDGDRVLVERTLASTILLESVRVSLTDVRMAEELKESLKMHDGKFYKLAKKTWSNAIKNAGDYVDVDPLRNAELKFRRYDGKKWEEVTKAEGSQKINIKFEIHPVMHFKDDGERTSVIKKLIE